MNRPGPAHVAPADPVLGELLDRVVAEEPPPHVTVDEVYGHAHRLRRRRLHTAVAAGVGTVVLVALAGYAVTSALSAGYGPSAVREAPSVTRSSGTAPSGTSASRAPGSPSTVTSAVSASVSSAGMDPVLMIAASAAGAEGHRVVPVGSWHGVGWRRYAVRDKAGRSRGTVEVTVYTAPAGLCFPPATSQQRSCAKAVSSGGVDYVPYPDVQAFGEPDSGDGGVGGDGGGPGPGGWRSGDSGDGSRRVNQVIARRPSDGWAVAVVAAGPAQRDARAPLSIDEVVRMATDPRLPESFGPDEWCGRPDPACPAPPVPLPTDD